jgi:hypothetical protein
MGRAGQRFRTSVGRNSDEELFRLATRKKIKGKGSTLSLLKTNFPRYIFHSVLTPLALYFEQPSACTAWYWAELEYFEPINRFRSAPAGEPAPPPLLNR